MTGIIADDLLKEQMVILDTELVAVQERIAIAGNTSFTSDYVFPRIRRMLVSPGDFWKKQPPHIKILFQWFTFPAGVLFDGTNFRTQKIHSTFMLKKHIQENLSFNVHYPKQYTKHQKLSNSPTPQEEQLLDLLQEIQNELMLYEEKVTTASMQETA